MEVRDWTSIITNLGHIAQKGIEEVIPPKKTNLSFQTAYKLLQELPSKSPDLIPANNFVEDKNGHDNCQNRWRCFLEPLETITPKRKGNNH